jgi:putative spermidine/putrescine transport system substrate-binding protein
MRRTKLLAGLLGGLFLLVIQSPVWGQNLEGTTLRVATWGGSWRDALQALIGKRLEARGVKVEYVIGNPAENLARLVAARGREVPFDVMEGSPELVPSMVREGFLQKVNLANIPNAKGLPAFAVSDYSLMTSATQDGIAYNEKKFKELGIPKPERYSDLMNPKLEGHVAFPEVAVTMHWDAVVGLAYDAGGNEATMEKAIEQIKKIKPLYYYPSSTDLVTKFNLGDVWAAPFHAGWVIRVKRTGFPIAHSHPRIGNKHGTLWPIYAHIPKGAKNVAAAEAFVNWYLDPEIQIEFAKKTGVVPINATARQALTKDPELASVLLLADEQLNNAFQVDWKKLDPEKWREMWNRFLGR